jgi:hypothetical protein
MPDGAGDGDCAAFAGTASFLKAGNYIAQWNGNSWSALGSGVNGNVSALAASGNTLYVGGNFSMAGEKVSANIAEAILTLSALPTFQGAPIHNANGSITLNLSTVTNTSSRLYSTTNLAAPIVWQPIGTNHNGGL